MKPTSTVHSLEDDVLGQLIIGRFRRKFRANTIALVCKAWQRVERKHAYQPKDLNLQPQQLSESYLTWHLRDTSRLKSVSVGGEGDCLKSDSYREGVPRALGLLHAWAPTLRCLELVPPSGNVPGGASTGILPLIAELSQLERLSLRGWKYTSADIANFHHLVRLQNLQDLEIFQLDVWRPEGHDSESTWEDAAKNFQEVIPALCQLTSLRVTGIDFLLRDVFPFLQTGDVGSLTKLRSLTYESCSPPTHEHFPFVDELVNLTRLELSTTAQVLALPPDMLLGLSNLKELDIKHGMFDGLGKVELAGSAEVTKLSLSGYLSHERPLDVVLPFQMLRHIRSLSVTYKYQDSREVQWPSTWGGLTNMTSLAVKGPAYDNPLDFVLDVPSLRLLKVNIDYKDFVGRGEDFILLAVHCLPLLSRLDMEVNYIPEADEVSLLLSCDSLISRMPGWVTGFDLIEDDMGGLGKHLTRIANFIRVK